MLSSVVARFLEVRKLGATFQGPRCKLDAKVIAPFRCFNRRAAMCSGTIGRCRRERRKALRLSSPSVPMVNTAQTFTQTPMAEYRFESRYFIHVGDGISPLA